MVTKRVPWTMMKVGAVRLWVAAPHVLVTMRCATAPAPCPSSFHRWNCVVTHTTRDHYSTRASCSGVVVEARQAAESMEAALVCVVIQLDASLL